MNDLLKSKEAAAYVGLNPQRFSNLARRGLGPAFVQPGTKWKFYRKEDLDEWKSSWIEGALSPEIKLRLRKKIRELIQNITPKETT